MSEKITGAFVCAKVPAHGAYCLVFRRTAIANGHGLFGEKTDGELFIPIGVPAGLAHYHVPGLHSVGVLGGISDICPEASHPRS